jgi:hypothetical protein
LAYVFMRNSALPTCLRLPQVVLNPSPAWLGGGGGQGAWSGAGLVGASQPRRAGGPGWLINKVAAL